MIIDQKPHCVKHFVNIAYLFVQHHVVFVVHLELGVALAGSFAGTELNININLTEETKSCR